MTFKISFMELLSEVLEDRAKELRMTFNIKDLNQATYESVAEILEENKGNKKLIMEVYDEEAKISLELLSRKSQVNITKKLIKQLDTLENVNFKLISKN